MSVAHFCLAGELAGFRLKKPLPLEIEHDEDGLVCIKNEELELYGCGETFREALEHLEAVFRAAVEEYLLSNEPISEEAERLREKLGQFVEVNEGVLRVCD